MTSATLVFTFHLAMLAAQQPAPAAAPPTLAPKEKVARDARALVEAHDAMDWFNGVALVARGEEVLYTGAGGLANAEFGLRNTAQTPFRIAGISQIFTAVAVLRLQDQGKLHVNDPAGKHMTGWPEAYRPITIHQLLINESGVKDVSQMPAFVRSVAVPRDVQELAEFILKEPVAGPPGTRSRAANSNYHLLAAIVERVAGVSFHEFIRREIIRPLGLTSTTHDDPNAVIPGRAAGYVRTPEGFRNAAWFHMNNAVGSANLVSTAGDVHKFLHGLSSGRLLKPESLALMTTEHVPGVTLGAASGAATGYGMNLISKPRETWTVGGSINGFMATMNHSPAGYTVIVLSNTTNSPGTFAVLNGIVASAAGRDPHLPVNYTSITPRPTDVEALAGRWELASAFTIGSDGQQRPVILTFRSEGARVIGESSGSSGTSYEWFASGPGTFFARHADAQIQLDPADRNKAAYVMNGRKSALTRVPATSSR